MRIAYLSGAYVPSRGANSMHAMRMCQAFAKLGHEVTLHVRPGDIHADDYSFYGVEPCFEIVKRARPSVRYIGAFANAWQTMGSVSKRLRPDLIYAREKWALALVARLGVPFVFESHWKPRSVSHRAFESYIMRHSGFRRVVFISKALRALYCETFPWLPRERTIVAHDAADLPPDDELQKTVRLGRPHALQVGYVGSFYPGYGIDLVEELALNATTMDFHVIGGDPELVAERKRRMAEVRNLFYHGFVAPSELHGLYSALDVTLAPYQATTPHIRWISPMKLFEYMAHGKAIVCSNFPVIREIIDNGVNGILVEAADVGAWKTALERLRDDELRIRLGCAARHKIHENHTWLERARQVLAGIAV